MHQDSDCFCEDVATHQRWVEVISAFSSSSQAGMITNRSLPIVKYS